MNDNLSDGPILDRIQKLFQLADPSRGATEHEIKSALEKAEVLMTRYHIDRSRLKITADGAFPSTTFEKTSIPTASRIPTKIKLIFSIIQRATPIVIILDKCRDFPEAQFIGSKTDITYSLYLYSYLTPVFDTLWCQYSSLYPSSDKSSYFHGLHDGICRSIQVGKQHTEEEIGPTERSRYEIVLRNEKEELVQYIQTKIGPTQKIKSRRKICDGGSYYAGRTDGENIKLHQPLNDSSK